MADRLALIALLVSCSAFAAESEPTEKQLVFESDIGPLLATKCGKCHSEKVRKGGLDLSSIHGLRRGGESGDALVADSLEDSSLWLLIEAGEMPPDDEPQLDDTELELVRGWIATGAASDVPATPAEKQITQHDVLPIMLLRCTACHGPRVQDGGLDLRTRKAMLRGGVSGPAIVPGHPEGSLLLERIDSGACPPRELLLKFFVRRPPAAEIKVIREWIASGAAEDDSVPDVATTDPDPLVSDEDRHHWAFQPPRADASSHSIDDFIQDHLEQSGLSFSPQADRDTLIRRVYLDLTGMPPSVEDWRLWRGSAEANWYKAMVDQLLASPRYGQRWGRYWLDLAGYADSEGGVSADPLRAVAWKYRDYVIRAFNDDKPYDRFLLEQIAGDELLDHKNASEVTPEMVDNLIATGFLRMGIDETGSRTMNFVPERLKVISDAITVVASGLMGLTMECARCHSHKYDPIPHRDYYRFKAIFQGALDEHDWSSFKNRTLQVATAEHRKNVAATNPPLLAEIKRLQSQQNNLAAEARTALLRHHYPSQSDSDNQKTLVALKIADNNRSLHQKNLVERLQRAELLPDPEQSETVLEARRNIQEYERQIDRVRRKMEPSLSIRALWDFGRPSPTYILRRGEYNKPGDLVGPGVPSVLTDGRTPFSVQPPFPSGTAKTGRRLALARWLAQPDHPLTARVMVNRIWFHHFAVGLVKDLNNFGVKGEHPSHPRLLDWLATQFIDRGWSIKEMHRLIMNSRVYRQSSRVTEKNLLLDPQNRLLSRMPLRRLDAEALRDSLLFVSGKLDDSAGGLPDTVTLNHDGLVSVNPTKEGRWRRSVYLQYRRTEIPTMMNTFDYPQMSPNCVERTVSIVSPQSLMLMNNGHVRELAAAFALRVENMAAKEVGLDAASADSRTKIGENLSVGEGGGRGEHVDRVYSLALSRLPSGEERAIGVATLKELESAWQGDPHRALETYCHMILNSAAFIHVD